MKKLILKSTVALIAILFGATACKKSKEDTPAPNSEACTLNYVVDDETGDSTTLLYDDQNRISTVQNYDETGAKGDYTKYVYGTNKVTVIDFYSGDRDTTYYQLNADGTAKYSATYEEYNGGTLKQYDTIFYTYDAAGYNTLKVRKYKAISSAIYSGSDTTWNTYLDGNLMTEKVKQSNGDIVTTTNTYTSILAKGIFAGDELIRGLTGNENKNLVQSTSNDTDSEIDTYTYEVNDQGYVTRFQVTYTNGGDVEESNIRLYYTCK